ncbi:MAG: M48 family peptidase, partial [Lutibacter sp.]|nr:M48 family peptidase [Lutibacter sp.]
MTPEILFYLLITIIIVKFLFDTFMDSLNARHFNDAIPPELEGIYNEEEYLKSQAYKKVNYKFSALTSIIS